LAARRDAAHDEVVAALRTPSADDVVAFLQLGEEVGYLVGRVLKVAVHRKNVVALCMVEPGG